MTDLAGAISEMPPDNYLRVGTVTAVNPLVLDLAGGVVERAGRLCQVGIGDRVACMRQGQSWLVLGRISPADEPQAGATAEGAISLANGWRPYSPLSGGSFRTPGYRRDNNGYVHLTGLMAAGTTGSNTLVGTLPAGFRPGNPLLFLVESNVTTYAARMDVYPSGELRLWGGNNEHVSLDTITFLAEN